MSSSADEKRTKSVFQTAAIPLSFQNGQREIFPRCPVLATGQIIDVRPSLLWMVLFGLDLTHLWWDSLAKPGKEAG